MPQSLGTFLERLIEQGRVEAIMTNEFSQFGIEPRQYIGAQLMPEETRESNEYRETEVYYRTVIAEGSSRYSPAQVRDGGVIGGEMLVELGESDISKILRGDRYDDMVEYLNQDAELASRELLDWVNSMLNMALVEYNELQRWNCLVNAQVDIEINGTTQTVQYPDPTGHRVSAAGDWSTDTYDPFDDIFAMQNQLRKKGYVIENIITSHEVMTTMRQNPKVAKRSGNVLSLNTTDSEIYVQSIEDSDVRSVFDQNNLPAPQEYNLNYYAEDGTPNRFLPKDAMVFTCRTGTETEVRLSADPEQRRMLRDTVGYTGIGTPAGQRAPGRAFDLQPKSDKPPRIEGDAWQTSLPVLTNPEAVGVIDDITLA
jgi:hypothetical protein